MARHADGSALCPPGWSVQVYGGGSPRPSYQAERDEEPRGPGGSGPVRWHLGEAVADAQRLAATSAGPR
jgi:hypothetical protein